MSDKTGLRLLVVSDLHAFCGEAGDRAPSTFRISGTDERAAKFFDDCLKALAAGGVDRVDAVLCAGDLTDKAEPEALERVWALLNDLATKLSAPLIATAGNHDLDSRGLYHVDPKDSLLDLHPYFPTGTLEGQLRYFAHHFDIQSVAGTRVVTLNSSAHHGLTQSKKEQAVDIESDHGRITSSTIARLKKAMQDSPSAGPSILLTHHHVVQLPDHDLAENSIMVDSGLLIDALAEDGQWLIIHGHKHRPYIHYAPGTGGSPAVFSAGSMGAIMDGEFSQAVENQFFLIELLKEEFALQLGLGVSGIVKTWTRSPWGKEPWRRATGSDAMPAVSGFGWRADPTVVASRIMDLLSEDPSSCSYADIASRIDTLPYLAPDDLKRTIAILEKRGCIVTFDANGAIERLETTAAIEVPDA